MNDFEEKNTTMFIKYYTREGNFNFCKPSELSYSCHLDVCDENANRIKSCNFTPERELNGTDIDEIFIEITDSLDRYYSTSNDRKEMIEFLEKNRSKIIKGNKKRRLAEIETEMSSLQEEKHRLEK